MLLSSESRPATPRAADPFAEIRALVLPVQRHYVNQLAPPVANIAGHHAGWFEYKNAEGTFRHDFGEFESKEYHYSFIRALHIKLTARGPGVCANESVLARGVHAARKNLEL